MKKLLPLMLVGVVVAMPALANKDSAMDVSKSADHWLAKMDTDGDGMVSRSEHDAFAEKMFHEADTNNDNMLSRDEMLAQKKKYHAESGYNKDTKSKMIPTSGKGKNGPRTEDTIHNREDVK